MKMFNLLLFVFVWKEFRTGLVTATDNYFK